VEKKNKETLPWWKQNGIIMAGGWHPITGRLRAGNQPDNVEEEYDWEYTEAHILRLKELGIKLLVSQFDRGLGDTDQAEDQERARLQAELCHKHGLRHGTYLANTVYFESMLKDYPECEDWAVVTHDGRKVHYGGEQTWRWVACFNSPGWRERMRRQVERAVNYVKTDFLHFDNLAVWPEPDSCHCRYCQEAFRKFLYRRYPDPASQKRRFGYPGFETFRAPNFYLRFGGPWDLDQVRNPLMQEWILFRCWTVTDYIREMSEYAHSLNPAICMESNGQSVWGVNQAILHGIDQEAQSAHVDVVCEENPDYRPDDDPRAIPKVTHKFRGMNFYRRLGKSVYTAYGDEETLAFNLTFAGNPGINQHWGYAEPGRRPLNPAQPGVAELLAHYRRHTALYTPVRSAARIGLWRSKLSLAFISTGTYLSACVLEQTLFNHRIPFSIISDGHVNGEKLKEFDLLILPDSQYVSQAQAAALIEFVKKGGSLLITENSGLYNDEGRRRTSPVFGPLFAGDWKAGSSRSSETWSFDPHQQFITLGEAGQPARALFGRGRAAYLPKLEYVYRPRTFKSRYNVHYDGIDSRYWKEPYNAAEVLETIQWLAPDSRPVTVYGNPELRLDYLAWPDGRLGAALLRCGPLAGTAEIALGVMSASKPAEGECLIPERKEPRPLTWVGRSDGYWETRLPEIGRHAVIRWRIVQKKKG